MTSDDVPTVFEIEQASHRYPWTRGMLSDCLQVGYYCAVIESSEKEMLGFGIMSMGAEECHILNLSVKPQRQREGCGRTLLEHLLEAARETKIKSAFLEVRLSNTAAIALYKKAGFNQIGIRKGYYPGEEGREDGVVMGLVLLK